MPDSPEGDLAATAHALTTVLAQVREVCADLPGAEEYVMVHHPAFRVRKKPFVVVGVRSRAEMDGHRPGAEWGEMPATVSINLGREAQGSMLQDERFSRTPYMGQHGWVTADGEDLPPDELCGLIEQSYERVAPKRR